MITSQVQLVLPAHVNNNNHLFGGQLMSWIDIVSAVAARRHAHFMVTTACVDQLEFLLPAHLGDLVRLDSRVTWTGRTSLEVLTESYVEYLDGTSNLINRAYLVFVALDEQGQKISIPSFSPSTPEEQEEWNRALQRREHRLKLRQS